MRLLTRHFAIKNQQIHSTVRLLNKDESSSSDSSDSDNDDPKAKHVEKFVAEPNENSKEQTADLLNNLLAQMSKAGSKAGTVDRSIPKREPLPKPEPKPTLEEKIVNAAKDVASTLGGDVKQTEVDLLNKIFSAGTPTPTSTTPESPTSGSTQTQPEESNLSHLLAGMKIDLTRKKRSSSDEDLNPSRTQRVKDMARKFQNINISPMRMNRAHSRTISEPGNLYGGGRLNIFEPVTNASDDGQYLKTWGKLEQDDLKAMMIHPPENIYQEMIQWTDRGILWKFPIDNEIGMDEEQNVHFSEHVFMDRHLKAWCPKRGPIRHFMELVCVGLSKNPYLTVQEKKDHIMWYQDFFSSKQQLLKEVGAIENDIPPSNPTKQIES